MPRSAPSPSIADLACPAAQIRRLGERSPDELAAYRAEKNAASIDSLTALSGGGAWPPDGPE
jgi:hypothetical protein